MKLAIIILFILVGLLYLKWFLIFLVYPWQALFFRYRKSGSLFYKILGIPFWILEKVCRGGWQRFSLYQISTIPSNKVRKWLYKGLGVECGSNTIFHYKTEIRAPYRLSVGDGTIIGDNALLDARNFLTIGRNVNFSSNVIIYTDQHDYRDSEFRSIDSADASVSIGDRAWLGSNVLVLPGTTIGEGAVCCSGCVVTKDVEPYSVVAGIPARKIGDRPTNLKYEFDGKGSRLI